MKAKGLILLQVSVALLLTALPPSAAAAYRDTTVSAANATAGSATIGAAADPAEKEADPATKAAIADQAEKEADRAAGKAGKTVASEKTAGEPSAGKSDHSSRIGVSADVRGSHVLNVIYIYDRLLQSYDFASPSVAVSFNTFPSDSCYWARAFNFPTLALGVSWNPYGSLKGKNGNGLGDMVNIFTQAQFDIWRSGGFSTGPTAELGLSYADRIYDPVTNYNNRYVGGHLDALATVGWQFSYLFAGHYELMLGAGVSHHSIGKMFLPNSGITEAYVSLGLRYHLSTPFSGSSAAVPEIEPSYPKGLRWNIYTACGLHSCETIWTYEGKWDRTVPLVRTLLGADAIWRYHPLFSSGIGIEAQYTTGIDRMRAAETALAGDNASPCSPFQAGVDLIQQFHYRNFSLHARIGVYVFRQVGTEEQKATGWCFQKIGFRYRIPKIPLYFGLDMRAHKFNSSDCLELSIGVEL